MTPPAALADLHQEALSYLERNAQWLALELDFVETGLNARIIEANDMIEEIVVRDFLVADGVLGVKFVYNIER